MRHPGPVSAATSTAARRPHARGRKALKILAFSVALVLGVLLALAILFRFAGGWGLPYFHFTTERGSRCVNTFTGFTCESVNLADVNYFGGMELPEQTQVVSSAYRSTHDYQLTAVLEAPPAAAAPARAALRDSFGRCVSDHPSPVAGQGLSKVCILANDTDVTESGVPDSRVYVVATGLRRDGARVINLSVRSR